MESIVIAIAIVLAIVIVVFFALSFIPGLDARLIQLIQGLTVIFAAAYIIVKLLGVI